MLEGNPEESDADIVLRTLADREAFADLIVRYEAKLDRYLRRLGVAREEERHDLLQDVFIKVYRNLQSFDTSLSFSAWIYRIAHNETMSWFRKRKARPEGHLVDDSEGMFEMLPGVERTDGAHLQAGDRDAVSQALELLPQKYRDVLVLRFFEDRTYDEIADILKIPMGTVATNVYRAKEQLRKLLLERGYLYGHEA